VLVFLDPFFSITTMTGETWMSRESIMDLNILTRNGFGFMPGDLLEDLRPTLTGLSRLRDWAMGLWTLISKCSRRRSG